MIPDIDGIPYRRRFDDSILLAGVVSVAFLLLTCFIWWMWAT
jgi:hypothetical protein